MTVSATSSTRAATAALGEEFDAEYAAAIAAFEEHFPGDPALDLISIDGHYLRGDNEQALAAIDRLDRRVGGDPYLDVLRGNTHFSSGDLALARAYADEALERERELEHAHWLLLSVALVEERFEEVSRLLNTLERDFDIAMDPDEMRLEPAYVGFMGSTEFDVWSANRVTAP